MTVSRDVIIDLLPLYLADEVSDATRELVETHLTADPQLAKLVDKMKQFDQFDTIKPLPPTHETELFNRHRQLRHQYNTFFLLGIIFTILWCGFVVFSTQVPVPGAGYIGLVLFMMMIGFWIGWGNVSRAMSLPKDENK